MRFNIRMTFDEATLRYTIEPWDTYVAYATKAGFSPVRQFSIEYDTAQVLSADTGLNVVDEMTALRLLDSAFFPVKTGNVHLKFIKNE